jgi:hypothetical protein
MATEVMEMATLQEFDETDIFSQPPVTHILATLSDLFFTHIT